MLNLHVGKLHNMELIDQGTIPSLGESCLTSTSEFMCHFVRVTATRVQSLEKSCIKKDPPRVSGFSIS